MEIKRILYIVTQAEWGGAQKYVHDLTESFLKQGFEIGVVAGTEKSDLFNKLAALESDKLTLFREKHLVRAINPYYDFIEFFLLVRIIWKFQPDVVHLNSSKAGILGTAAGAIYNFLKNPLYSAFRERRGESPFKKGRKVRIIYTAHGFVFNENLSVLIYLFYLWSEKICSWIRDKIIAVSFYDLKSALEKRVAEAGKMVVIHNGIDLSKRNEIVSKVEARGKLKNFVIYNTGFSAVNNGLTPPSPSQWGILETATLESPETQIVGTVANFYKNKGLLYLIEAAKEVIKDMPNVCFVLIGKGEMERKLRKIIYDKRLEDKFFITGVIPDAYKYFRGFDIFCLPSIKEGLSYTLLESLMAELPIVATNVGGNPEIVKDGENGFLVPPKDKNALAKKIKLLLKDSALKERMGERSYHKASGFSLEKMVAQTKEVYKSL